MAMKHMFVMFVSLALGYVLCVLAKREKGALKSLGYALGISVLVLTLAGGLVSSYSKCIQICKDKHMSKACGVMSGPCPMMKK